MDWQSNALLTDNMFDGGGGVGGEIDGEGREGNKRDEGGRGDRKDMGHHEQGACPALQKRDCNLCGIYN